jgi:hypothetical protein
MLENGAAPSMSWTVLMTLLAGVVAQALAMAITARTESRLTRFSRCTLVS